MIKRFLFLHSVFFAFIINAQVHTTNLWLLQLPVYWPEKSTDNPNCYQNVKALYDSNMSGGNYDGYDWHIPITDSMHFENSERPVICICLNPFKGHATIEIDSKRNLRFPVQIPDINGNIVKSSYIDPTRKRVFCNQLSPGIYNVFY